MLGQYVPLDLSALDFLQIVIGAMTAAIAVFSALLLLSRDHDARMRALGLALFFLATAVSELDELYMHAGGYALHPWSIALAWPLIVIIGPAILLYVRDMTAAGRPPMTPVRFARYAWPVPAGYLIALPFFLRPGEEKLAILAGADMPATFASAVPAILGVLFLIIALASLMLAFRGLLAHMRSLRNLFANIEDKSLNWVRAVLLVLSAAWIWGAASTLWRLDDQVPQWQGPLASILEMGWVFAFAFFGIRQGEIFPARTAPAPAEPAKYTRSALDAQRMDRIAGRIETAMREQHLYRNPALSCGNCPTRSGSPRTISPRRSMTGWAGTSSTTSMPGGSPRLASAWGRARVFWTWRTRPGSTPAPPSMPPSASTPAPRPAPGAASLPRTGRTGCRGSRLHRQNRSNGHVRA